MNDSFYEHLKEVHDEFFPSWRFGQFMLNFFGWITETKQRDIFFYEDDQMSEMLDEYVDYLTDAGEYLHIEN